MSQEVAIGELVAEGTTQARHYDDDLVAKYADAMKLGAVFPPVIAFQSGNGLYLADGFHRRGAALKLGETAIQVDIRKPFEGETPQRSAILYAVGANDDHGNNRSNDDKRHAVEMLLRDPEWSKWTDREIARQCHVANSFVSTQRTKLINAGTLKKADKRTTKRGGKEYQIDTAKIGKPKKEKPAKAAKQSRTGAAIEKPKPDWTGEDEHAITLLRSAWKRATMAARAKFREEIV